MDHWIQFVQDKWVIVLVALVLLFIVMRIVKNVVKWVLILAILGGTLYYGYQYKDTLIKETGKSITETVTAEIEKKALDTVTKEAKDAKYTTSPDGTFTVSTKNIKIEGKPGEPDVKVTFLGQSFKMNANAVVKAMIEQAKKNGNN